MSRTSRIPYHQNVYDYHGLSGDDVSAEALALIEAFELWNDALPGAVREWYLQPTISVPDASPGIRWTYTQPKDPDAPEMHTFTLSEILRDLGEQIATRKHWPTRTPRVCISDCDGISSWVDFSESDDPPVWQRNFWESRYEPVPDKLLAERFSDYAYAQQYPQYSGRREVWLRTPAEPFQPPVIDFLTEQLDEPERTPRPGNVTTYTFRPPGGIIRVTADEPSLTGGLSAWWLHADTAERLAEFARLVLPFGTLRETLCADTDAARVVLRAIAGR